MRVAPRLAAVLALAAGLLAAESGRAVPQEPQQTPEFQDQVSVGLVLVPVVVRSGAGFSKNLDKKDFQLRVEGKPVAIESFERRSDAPASVVLLQDLSGSMANGGKLEESRDVLRFLLDKSLPGDEIAIATFASDLFAVEVPFTQNQAALREASDRWRAYGTTALHDAVARMPQISLEGRNPKRFAILITDGVDNASHLTPEQARAVVQEAHLPTYVLGLDAGNPYELSQEGKKIYRYADVLSLLAAVTGGRYYAISNREDLQKALAQILDDVRHQYVLGFSTGDGPVKFRPLSVEVKKSRDRRTVVFRRGYKGTPPAEPRAGG
ncbi:MAG TPA: VWA domain-containing protein [Thermoanaerobaculia bacterium]|jgi:VWFA-related protein